MPFAFIVLPIALSLSIAPAKARAHWHGRFEQRSTMPSLEIPTVHNEVLTKWLSAHPGLRPARFEDCDDRVTDSQGREHRESCEQVIRKLREWTKDPDTNPFYAKGDFNGDGIEDFAVVLTLTNPATGGDHARVVVFNGSVDTNVQVDPAFSVDRKSVSTTFLGFGPPRPKPWHLIIGLPESEGQALIWRNGRYVLR